MSKKLPASTETKIAALKAQTLDSLAGKSIDEQLSEMDARLAASPDALTRLGIQYAYIDILRQHIASNEQALAPNAPESAETLEPSEDQNRDQARDSASEKIYEQLKKGEIDDSDFPWGGRGTQGPASDDKDS